MNEYADATPPTDAALADEAASVVSGLRRANDLLRSEGFHPEAFDFSKAANFIERMAAALRARAVPTHNLTGHDVDDIARVLCWLKNGDTPPAAQIERIVHRNAELRGIVDDMRARAVPDEPVESILAAYKTGISHGKEQTNHEFEFAPGSASDKAYTTGYNEGYEQRLAMLAASKGAKQ